jgi:hypothetical protein
MPSLTGDFFPTGKFLGSLEETPCLKAGVFNLPKIKEMNNEELIKEIFQMNKNAQEKAFLTFTDDELRSYLQHLRDLEV